MEVFATKLAPGGALDELDIRFYRIGNGVKEVLDLARLLADSIKWAWIIRVIVLGRSSILVAQMVSRCSPYLGHCKVDIGGGAEGGAVLEGGRLFLV